MVELQPAELFKESMEGNEISLDPEKLAGGVIGKGNDWGVVSGLLAKIAGEEDEARVNHQHIPTKDDNKTYHHQVQAGVQNYDHYLRDANDVNTSRPRPSP